MTPVRTHRQAYVGGAWVDGADGVIEVRSPHSGEAVGTVTRCTPDDVGRAVRAAREAFPAWKRTPLVERVDLLYRAYDLCKQRNEAIARQISEEMGKTIRESREEMAEYACEHFRRAAEDALRYRGQVLPSTQERTTRKRIVVTQEPAGVVAVVTPWNFPVDIAAIAICYALAIGDTVVWKPSEYAPLSSAMLADVFHEAGFPPGTVNMVTGEGGIGRALVEHPDISAVVFTGSTKTGQAIAASAGLKKRVLELGGNGPIIVRADADLDRAADATIVGCYYLAGQCCTAAERVLVHESVREGFLDRLAERVRKLRVGDPMDEATDMGPLCNQGVLDRTRDHVNDAVANGATVVLGGTSSGLHFAPTVLDGVTPAMLIAREETFGPVAPIMTFSSDDEAITTANGTGYGLTAAVFTNDLRMAWRFAESLDHGTVMVNETTNYWDQLAPFGGRGKSGTGRELSSWMLDALTDTKQIVFDIG
ncbi:MAG: aldehyde dehydrogenase family protein [Streptosporangiaceae bacterium]